MSSTLSEPTASNWAERLRGSPEQANAVLRELYLAHKGRLLAHLRRRVGSDQAEEVLQICFVTALESRFKLKADSDRAVIAWLWGICENQIKAEYRRVKKHQHSALPDESVSVDTLTPYPEADFAAMSYDAQLDDRICVQKALAEFYAAEPQRAQALVFYVEGYSYEELALYLNRTPQAARQYLYECRKKIKPLLEACKDRCSRSDSLGLEAQLG